MKNTKSLSMASRLCDDMVKAEILSRTSLKTLDLIRCTSKEFEKLTYEHHLFNLYKQRNDIVSGFIMEETIRCTQHVHEFAPSRGSNNIDLGFLPPNARIRASSEQGIIVFETPHPRTYGLISYFVCKPATKQVLQLPNPKTKYLTRHVSVVVMGSNPLHYKIVRLSETMKPVLRRRGGLYITYRCEIFDSRTWAWKLMDLLMFPFPLDLHNPELSITTRGSVYMFLTNHDILKFDAYSDEWTTFSPPLITTLDDEFYTPRQLVKHEGRLGFACRPSKDCWEIWVLGTNERWEKICVINEQEGVYSRKLSFDDPNTSIMIYNGVILFHNGNIVGNITTTRSKMFVYRSDFEPTNLTGRPESRL